MPHTDPAVLHPADGVRPFCAVQYQPDAAIAGFVDHLWSVEWSLAEGAAHEQEVLPSPVVHLTLEDRGAHVYGVPTCRFVRQLTGRGRVVGVSFRPGGFAMFSRVRPVRLRDISTPADEVFGPWVAELPGAGGSGTVAHIVTVVAEVLARHAREPDADAVLVNDAVAVAAAERSLTKVGELAARLGVTPRTLQRRFEEHIGVGPKWVLRRQRIHDALHRLHTSERVDWVGLAAELGFADQAHLNRTFRAMIGVTPATYQRRVAAAIRP